MPNAEVKAVREAAGLIDVSTLGKIKLTGPGVPELLNKLYINRWMKLRIGRVRYGIMCNSEGVVMDDGVTARLSETEWYMSTTSSGAGAVFEWIQWWLQSGWGDGIHAIPLTDGLSAFNLAGPKSRTILAKLTDKDISNDAFPYMHVREMKVASVPARVMRIGFTGELSYEIHCPSSMALHVWESLMEAGEPDQIMPFGVEAQRILRLEKAHLIVGQDTDATSDPISAGQAWAVKLDKPDFLGQRSLKRVAEHGAIDMLVGFKMVDQGITPEEGLQIVTDTPISEAHPLGIKIIGWVTSSRYSPTINESIGLCWLPTELAEQERAEFNIRRNGELIRAKVHHGAFVDPDGGRLRI
ncbi:aminomethyltransferase family protein [Chloroflexi bacterium TSY]|nr:aminomethyltransferase family protein [Chloroflexi bacterium TSY]